MRKLAKGKVLRYLIPVVAAAAFLGLLFFSPGRKNPANSREDLVSSRERAGANHLENQKSPYLREHSLDPVNWYPWGSEAFKKAERENKPVFLSIGYSTCHWCHVMQKEDFENFEVASSLNKTFVCVLVDREEHPEIDDFYQQTAFILSGEGGWPLTLLMTPDKKPFFATTYLPKTSRFGQIGILELVPKVEKLWKNKRKELENTGNGVLSAFEKSLQQPVSSRPPAKEVLDKAYTELSSDFDSQYGGFGQPPKFPQQDRLLFLLHDWKRTGNKKALAMVGKTLDAMRQGGIFDQLGFGFHRYSTDAGWTVPHFEKMLYDQALIATVYLEAYQAIHKPEYAETAREIFAYVGRDLTSPEGGFYSAQDADSQGQEGKYYRWTPSQVEEVLGKKEGKLYAKVFGLDESDVLHFMAPLPALSRKFGIPLDLLETNLEKDRKKLLEAREERVHPQIDKKILADWNGLMIGSLAFGGEILNKPGYVRQAEKAADFILTRMRSGDGGLFHESVSGKAEVTAKLDDYAYFIQGLLNLYESTFRIRYLQEALSLNTYLVRHFWDEKNGGFFLIADFSHELPFRQKEIEGELTPSGNAVEMLNLLRLSRLTGNPAFEEKADAIGKIISPYVKANPSGDGQFLLALDFAVGPSYEVVIAGNPNRKDTKVMLQALDEAFIPNKVVLLRPPGNNSPILKIAPYVRAQISIDGKATAYVCLNFACEKPTTRIDQMLKLFQR